MSVWPKWMLKLTLHNSQGTRDNIANIHWIIEKVREFQKNIYFYFIDYAKAFDCVDHNKLWKILKEMGLPDHFTCLLRNLYIGQEATVRTGYGTNDFQIGKGLCQGCMISPSLLRLSEELYDVLAAWAEDEFRSVNGQIEYLLTECVRARRKQSVSSESEDRK